MKGIIHPYKKESDYSYAAGAYATFELLATRPEHVKKVVIHSDYREPEKLQELCCSKSVIIHQDDRLFRKINQKENTYVLGLFTKYACKLSALAPHVVLVNPSDMGNLGTIIRTLAGLNITNLAVIMPAADLWHPKTIRASMGAVFRMEIELFASFEEYRKEYALHKLYPFMLDGEIQLNSTNCPYSEPYSLVFGNEATGLPENFRSTGTSVKIPQSAMVDSLNLSVAVGIAAFLFASVHGQV